MLGALLIAAPLAARAASLDVRPVASADDGEEFATGSMYLNSTDLELTHDTSDQTIGIRWILAIPPGATITAATIQFSAKESWPDATNLTFACQATDNAGAFTTTKFDISTRARTSHVMTWPSVPVWNVGETGPNEKTPDLSQVIQEVVGRPNWASGNALAVIITGTGHRTAYSWDGKAASAPLLHVEYTTGPPPPDQPPVARLTVSQLASPPLTVKADGSTSTDTDATPIATYHFDFGDGSPVVDTPSSTQNHTYSSAGPYTVKLTCTDTGNLTSSQVSQSITVTSAPPPDNAPVARLTVSQLASPALTVKADGSTSTDTDATPIATYHYDFGDGSAVVNTSSSTQNHTYGSSGTYTVKLTCTDTGNLTSTQVSQSITVTPPATGGGTVAVYAGYYDTHHPNHLKPKPNPWRGSAGTVFVGTPDKSGGNDWDTSALRVDNLTGSTLSGVVVSVDVGTKHFALWGTNSIPAGQHLVLAQTAFENFDGSDLNSAGCYSCNPNDCLTKVKSTVPVVHVTVGGTTTNYNDVTQQINTGGVDRAGCPYTGTRNDESENWVQLAAVTPAMAEAAIASADRTPLLAHSLFDDPPPQSLWLGEPFPNPSRGELTLRFSLPVRGPVKLEVFDISGRLVRVAIDQVMEAGTYEDNARMDGQKPGVYFYRLTTRQGQQRRTFVLER